MSAFSWKRSGILLTAILATVSVAEAAYKPGEVIVKYKQGVLRSRSVMNVMYENTGVQHVRRFQGIMKGFEQLTLRPGLKVEDAIYALQKSDMVEYAQPNYMLYALPIRTAEGGIPCIPGMEIPGCDNGGGGGGGGGGEVPCIFPGIPYPPGCKDDGGGGGGGGGEQPPTPPANRPALNPPPAEVNPPVADPDLSQAYGLDKIQATKAWEEYKGDKKFLVADIDTGIDYNHEDLSFNLWRNPTPSDKNDVVGFDFVHNDGLPYDDNQHGTHTAGTIGAVGGNGIGVSGVAPRISIMALKFLSGEGSGTTADAIRAIDYAVEHGARVLSNSWGGKGDPENSALSDSIERARQKGVLFVAAAGNDSTNNDQDPSYPAAFTHDNMLSVAATDANDKMAFFSNYGVKTTHVAAPGANVYSTVPGNKYAKFSGTSMACPHVAGAAAYIWSKHPEWDYKKVKQILMDTGDTLSALQGKVMTGKRINLLNALHAKE